MAAAVSLMAEIKNYEKRNFMKNIVNIRPFGLIGGGGFDNMGRD